MTQAEDGELITFFPYRSIIQAGYVSRIMYGYFRIHLQYYLGIITIIINRLECCSLRQNIVYQKNELGYNFWGGL